MTVAVLGVFCARVLGLVALAGLATTLMRRRPAAERHWIWLIALSGSLALPVIAAVIPALPILPIRLAQMGEQPTAARDPLPSPYGPGAANAPDIARPAASAPARPRELVASRAALEPVRGTARQAIAVSPIARSEVLLLVWCGGVLIALARLGRAHRSARRLVKNARPYLAFHESGDCRVVISGETQTPFVYGIRRPVVVLPEEAAGWSAGRLRATLLHEAAHARRGDGATLLITQLASAVYWFHPAVLYAAFAASIECERACDDLVLEGGIRPSEYGGHLLVQAQQLSAWMARSPAAAFFGHSRGLSARIAALLDPRLDRHALVPRRAAAFAALGLAVIIALAAAVPRGAEARIEAPVTAPRPADARIQAASAAERSESVPLASLRRVEARASASALPSTRKQIGAPVAPTACEQADVARARTVHMDAQIAFTGAGSMPDSGGGTRYVWTGVDCVAWVSARGAIVVAKDERDVGVPAGGEFSGHEEGPEGTRDFRVSANQARSFSRASEPVTPGASDREWMAAMVREYVRRSGVGAEARARAVALASGSVGIIAEARHIPRFDVRATYLVAGFAAMPDASGRIPLIRDGAALLDESDSKARFLMAVPGTWRNDVAVLHAIYTQAAGIEADDALESLLRAIPPPRPLPAELRSPVESMIATLANQDRRIALTSYYLGVRP